MNTIRKCSLRSLVRTYLSGERPTGRLTTNRDSMVIERTTGDESRTTKRLTQRRYFNGGLCAASIAIIALLCAVRVQAQTLPLVIHHHPQKAVYATTAEMPTDSAQGHWLQRNGVLAHTHVDFVNFPRYAEISGPLTVRFVVTLFHTDAQIRGFSAGHWNNDDKTSITWDDTGTSTAPVMIGDPNGVKTWSGVFTVAPRAEMLHGWDIISAEALTQFSDGAATATRLADSIFMVTDPSAPLPTDAQFPSVLSYVRPTSVQFPDRAYGYVTAQFNDYLPLAPIAAPWPMPLSATYAYGGRDTQRETTELRLDLDLHHGIAGTELFHQVTPGDLTHQLITLDPAQMGPGPHKIAFMRNEFNEGEQLSSLFVTFLNVDPAAPPPACAPPTVLQNNQCVDLTPLPVVPPTCTAPAMLMNGQCVTMPPPPPPPPALTVVKIQMCAIETLSDGSLKNKCIDLP